MLKASSRWLLVHLVLFGVVGSLSASAALVTDFSYSAITSTWTWHLDLQGDTVALHDPLKIFNDSGHDWSKPGAWTTSQPPGWAFWRDPLNATQNVEGVTKLLWRVTDPTRVNTDQVGLFSVHAVGAGDDTGTATVKNAASGNLLHVPQVPEAGTLSLLAVGLLAGALLKRRRKETD